MKEIFETIQQRILKKFPLGLYVKGIPKPTAFNGLTLAATIYEIITNQQANGAHTFYPDSHDVQYENSWGCYRSIQELYAITYFYKKVSFEDFIVALVRMELEGTVYTYRCTAINRWTAATAQGFHSFSGMAYAGYLNKYSEFDEQFGINLPEKVREYIHSLTPKKATADPV